MTAPTPTGTPVIRHTAPAARGGAARSAAALALGIMLTTLPSLHRGALAHHPAGGAEARLSERERFFQPLEARPTPDFTLRDPEGRSVSLADLRGKAVVLHFVYAGCPDVCPLHADLIARVQGMVNQTPMRDLVRFVSITTDPERDTPEVLQGYGETRGLDPANWVFLTSGPERPEETRRLVEAFGHRFTLTPDGLQMHGVVTHVIGRDGQLRANFHGLDFDPTNLVLYLNALSHESQEAPSAPAQGVWERLRNLF